MTTIPLTREYFYCSEECALFSDSPLAQVFRSYEAFIDFLFFLIQNPDIAEKIGINNDVYCALTGPVDAALIDPTDPMACYPDAYLIYLGCPEFFDGLPKTLHSAQEWIIGYLETISHFDHRIRELGSYLIWPIIESPQIGMYYQRAWRCHKPFESPWTRDVRRALISDRFGWILPIEDYIIACCWLKRADMKGQLFVSKFAGKIPSPPSALSAFIRDPTLQNLEAMLAGDSPFASEFSVEDHQNLRIIRNRVLELMARKVSPLEHIDLIVYLEETDWARHVRRAKRIYPIHIANRSEELDKRLDALAAIGYQAEADFYTYIAWIPEQAWKPILSKFSRVSKKDQESLMEVIRSAQTCMEGSAYS